MLVDTFANRLKKALDKNKMTQSQLAKKTNIDKSLISNSLSGNYNAKQDKLSLLADALNVTETWLMGYDTDKEEINSFDELELLFDKNKNILTEDDKQYIKFIIEKRRKDIDKQLGKEE